MNPKTEELLKAVERARRDTHYPIMDEKAEELLALLKDDESSAAWAVRSKVSYELQMGTSQQAEAFLNKAKMLAEQAIEEAEKAGDAIGILFARMTLGGHILPALGKGQEAIGVLRGAYHDAKSLLAKVDEKDEVRVQRIIMNCCIHLLRLTAEYRWCPADVEGFLRVLETNPVFEQYKYEGWAKQAIANAKGYIASKYQ